MRSLDRAAAPIPSALAVFESVLAVTREKKQSIADSDDQVTEFLRTARIRPVSVGEPESRVACEAYDRHGKGRGHPAQLNMG